MPVSHELRVNQYPCPTETEEGCVHIPRAQIKVVSMSHRNSKIPFTPHRDWTTSQRLHKLLSDCSQSTSSDRFQTFLRPTTSDSFTSLFHTENFEYPKSQRCRGPEKVRYEQAEDHAQSIVSRPVADQLRLFHINISLLRSRTSQVVTLSEPSGAVGTRLKTGLSIYLSF